MSTASDSLPRVSTILRVLEDSYIGIPEGVLVIAAERGEALHRLCLSWLASRDGLCEAPIVGEGHEYYAAFNAFVRWCLENAVEPVAIEQPSASTQHGYRGTPDALVLYGPHKLLTIIDLKFTATIMRTNRVQVQAYWRLDDYKQADRAMLLHINPKTGDLKAHKITKSPHDWAGFLNALSVWKWRQQ